MADLRIILDPGGSEGREGFNIAVYPNGTTPLTVEQSSGLERKINGGLIATGFPDRLKYSWTSLVPDPADRRRLQALENWIKEAQMNRAQWEIVIYQLAEPYSEPGPNKTRYQVPGTTDLAQVDGFNGITYWIALQGFLTFAKENFYTYRFTFQEGTKLVP
jgi:hypothetical protein